MTKTDNQKYVRRGQGLPVRYDSGWEDDLKKANHSKEGAPFLYADALIMLAASLRTVCSLPYRQLSGLLAEMLAGYDSPHYSVLCRRINRLDVDIDSGLVTVSDPKKSMIMAVDATGLKVSNRGEWIRKKWKTRRGFVKMHLLVCVDTQKILAAVVTDDRTGDSPMLKNMLETVIKTQAEEAYAVETNSAGQQASEPDGDKHVAVIGRRVDPVQGSMIPVDPTSPEHACQRHLPAGSTWRQIICARSLPSCRRRICIQR